MGVFFAFIEPINFSGQSAASELIIEVLEKRNWECIKLPMYPLKRGVLPPLKALVEWYFKHPRTFRTYFTLLRDRNALFHLNLGQSLGSFVRAGLWFFPLRLLRPDIRIVISLHGSVFMNWQSDSIQSRFFMLFLKTARIVTINGDNQKRKLMTFGLSEERIRVVLNTCEMKVVSEEFLVKKHRLFSEAPLRILHLSKLIESKGYPEYLEALEILARKDLQRPVYAVLCGPMSFTSYCRRFTDKTEKADWIRKKIATINNTPATHVTVEWIEGARGEEKQRHFEDAHIFVLPTRFPVEASPHVLLEALATGCAVITSKVGEIPSTVDNRCARMLDDLSPENIASEIRRLMDDSERRLQMARHGLELMQGRFSNRAYADNWERLFLEAANS